MNESNNNHETEKRKFKAGDKVRIKDGISSRTHDNVSPGFMSGMDNLIGKTMTVNSYSYWDDYVYCEETVYSFLGEWLEPYVEALKKDDLAIFWNKDKEFAIIKLYNKKDCGYHYDNSGVRWDNAIKFESKEQFDKLLRGK